MSEDDYLWNQTGEPDADTVRLENLMGRLRRAERVPVLRRSAVKVALLAAAATVALVYLWPKSEASSWKVDDAVVYKGDVIRQGQLVSESVGSLRVEQGSRLRLKEKNHFALERGVVHALVWAPPREFVVDTPSAKAVDLGCQYTLSVNDDGSGFLRVEMGWVALAAGKLEAFVPAGAECRTRRGRGPGTPYWMDAEPALKSAVERWDSGDRRKLAEILSMSREKDALTLWHLLGRGDAETRRLVADRFMALVPFKDRDGLLRGDAKAMDQAWEALGLGGASWWRGWKQNL